MADQIGLAVAILALVVFVPPLLAPSNALVASLLPESLRLVVGGPVKLVLLAGGAWLASRLQARLGSGHPARSAWALLGTGLAAWSLGQAVLVAYQLVLEVPLPFPSAADVFFLIGYALLVPALILHVRAWRRSGLPLDPVADILVPGLVAALTLAVVLTVGLRDLVAASGTNLDLVLSLIYPLADAVLLLPAALLLRLAWRLRGGAAAGIWGSIAVGLVLLVAGDIGFAYLANLGVAALDPLVDLLFIAGYGGLARGAALQLELLSH